MYKTMNIKRIKNSTAVLLVLFMLVSCADDKSKTAEAGAQADTHVGNEMSKTISFSKDQYALADINTGKVVQRNISDIIKLNGKIEVDPTNVAVVSAQLGGYIKTAGLIVGTPIKKGQVLATIENVEFINIQQEYLESTHELAFLEQEYLRQKQLRDDDINSKKTFQKVDSQYEVLKGKVSALEQKLALIGVSKKRLTNGLISRTANLYAPIGGYIKTSNAMIGAYVPPTDIVFEIVNTDRLHLELHAYESNVNRLTIGQKVHFGLSNETDFGRTATIEQIGKASGNDRVIIVHCAIDKNSLTDLLPDMYIKSQVEISVVDKKQSVVPTQAIVAFEGKSYIISEDNKSENDFDFSLVEIKKGVEQDGFTAIEVSERPLENLTVVTQNAYAIASAFKNAQEGEGGGHGH